MAGFPPVLTLADCVLYSRRILQHRIVDSKRFESGVDIVEEAFKELAGKYDINPRGDNVLTRRCHFRVSKFTKKGEIETTYFVNLSKELGCTCPDVEHNGIITCKHQYACMLWQMAHDMYNDYLRSKA